MRDPTRYCVLLSLLILFLSCQTFPQTHIPAGNVKGKWLKQNSPYYIDGEIKIPHGNKLIIEPGVKIIFTGHHKLIVNGILEARGTEQDSIYFFPSDTSVGWHGIRFIEAEDFSALEYCVLCNGKTRMSSDQMMAECKSDPKCDEKDFDGGAILIYKSHPSISHCLISDNMAKMNGGGIAIENNSNPEINFCQIENNKGTGGIYCADSSNLVLRNCIIVGNGGGGMGGGLSFDGYCSPTIENCVIKNNYSNYRGGGICFYTNLKPVLKNSVIADNKAVLGGGIYIDEFYNVYRERTVKIDIQIINSRIEKNSAEYGGGIWLRDAVGKFSGITVCNNTASIAGGGIHIEYNPFLFRFSTEYPCNIYMNFARLMGNDLFNLGGGVPIAVPLDTFTVKYYSAINVEPVEKFPLTIKNFKLTQVNANLYVSPDGDDSNSGLSSDDALKTLRIALLRILADSTNPRTVYMVNGEYIFNETDDILLLGKHKYVNVKGAGFSDIIFGTDRITVFTPWWITTWALIIYASTLLSVILVIWNVRMRRIRIRSELEKKEFEAQKLHEVDEIKTRFFTNISHEFRTPLTLILGPVKQAIERIKDQKTKDDLSIADKNANKLLGLVNQLLDISKLESGNMKLRTHPLNFVALLKALTLSFASYAERKRITLKFNSSEDEIIVYADKDKIEKIFTNILSNAFKFTPEGGKIEVILSKGDKFLNTIISDTGIGIPKEKTTKIFDRFYQVDGSHTRAQEGTGIGLALTKELVDLHKGKIEVESEESKGTIVTVSILLGKEHLQPEEISEQRESEYYEQSEDIIIPDLDQKTEKKQKIDVELLSNESLPLLLIVEDNADVRRYIKDNLIKEFRTIEAVDGEAGWNKSIEHMPDLIVSDIMMPKMDGFKLCEKLKTDERTSHIPIILLTAKAAKENKLEGYELGADEYLMKPFESVELKARIKNLIEQRKRIHEHFRNQGIVELDHDKISSIDKKFLRKAFDLIHQNISDASFNVEAFGEKMGMSRSVLHKKISSLAGEPPVEFIRRIRLNYAQELIEKKFGNLSEIALESGFNSPAYFSECFKKQFGITPSQYQQKITNS